LTELHCSQYTSKTRPGQAIFGCWGIYKIHWFGDKSL